MEADRERQNAGRVQVLQLGEADIEMARIHYPEAPHHNDTVYSLTPECKFIADSAYRGMPDACDLCVELAFGRHSAKACEAQWIQPQALEEDRR